MQLSADKTATVAPRPSALLGPHLCSVRPAFRASVAYSHPMQLASVGTSERKPALSLDRPWWASGGASVTGPV